MVQEELCLLALQAAEDAYNPLDSNDFASLEPPDGYIAEWIWDDPATGFKAVLYTTTGDNGARHGIVAFTGTEDSQDALADLSLGWDQWQINKTDFFDGLTQIEFSTLLFTGHSLGGALAQYATYDYTTTYASETGTSISLVTFNGLGGLTALEHNVDGFDAAALPSFDNAHFMVDGDFVARLGGGHLGGEVYLLQRVASADYFDPVIDHATYLDGSPFNLLSGHSIRNVQSLVAIDGFQFFQAHAPDYLELSAILSYATELTFSILDSSRQVDDSSAINLLAAGLTATLAEVARLPEGSLEREQLETLLTEATANLRDGTTLLDYEDRVLYTLLSHTDLVGLASLPIFNDQLESASFYYSVETLLADAMQHTDNRLGSEGANAFATLLIDYAHTMGLDLAGFEDALRERLVERFTAGEMFDEIDIANTGRFLTTVLDSFIESSELGSSVPEDAQGVFRIGGKALIAGDDMSPRILDGSEGDDVLLGTGELHEVHQGFAGDDLLYGAGGRDLIRGGTGDDWLLGGQGDDVLVGGQGNDRLEDGFGTDRLSDAGGDDAYYLLDDGEMDTVFDADGEGRLYLGGIQLTGGFSVNGSASHFSDGVHTYRQVGGDLVIDDTVTLRDWASGDLGIVLDGAPIPPEPNLVIGSDASETGTTLEGTEGDDAIYGLGGDDDLSGGLGNDQLYGGNGSDWLSATPGDDLLDGGPGDDVLISGIDQDILLGGSGTDFLSAGDGRDRLEGGTDDDILAAGAGDDLLAGGDGNDRLYGDGTFEPLDRSWSVSESTSPDGLVISVMFDQVVGTANSTADGDDMLSGGDGDDDLLGGGGDDWLAGDSGDDYLDGGYGNDHLDGGEGNDALHGDAKLGSAREAGGMDLLSGGPGNDWLEGGYGADQLDGGDGNDELHGDYLDDPILGGNDLLSGGAGDDLLLGGAGDDAIYGGDGSDRADAGNGDDRLWGGAGSDTLLGDAGADLLHGGYDDDLLLGGSGDDGLDGGPGHDRIEGEFGNDRLLGGSGDDTLVGGDGDDVLSGEQGQDLIDGGPGADRLTGGDGNDHLQSGSGDDHLEGNSGDDVLLGQEGHDQLHGGDGNDSMAGGPGDDTVFGDAGDDQLWGEEGNDLLLGSQGNDILAGGADNDDLRGGDDDDRLYGEDGDDLLHGETGDDLLAGGLGHDALDGGSGNDQLYGEPGDDILDGDTGADLLVAGPGDDLLSGGVGDDRLHGESGNDRLRGGPGNDLLVGGAGDDRYLFEAIDGQIRIVEQGDSLGDTLELGDGLAASDFVSGRDGDDLVLQHLSGDQRVSVTDWFASSSNRLASIHFSDGTTWTPDMLENAVNTLVGSLADDTLVGDQRGETLMGLGGADILHGLGGDDLLQGGAGDDLLVGGPGNDGLEGGNGSDIFQFATGDGTDRLLDAESVDTLQFMTSRPEDLDVSVTWDAQGHQLTIAHGSGDQVLIDDGLHLADLTIAFRDSTPNMTFDALLAGVALREGHLTHRLSAGGLVEGTRHADHVLGSAGNDTVLGMGGNDLIVTGAGDDVLDGGVGDDILEGGTGIDTYRFEYGSGHDTIIETGLMESSVIEIGSGVSLADLDITHDGDHLRLGILGSETSLTYLDWRNRRDVAPLEVRFNDGMQLTETELELKIKTGTDSADTLRSNRRAERLLGHGGDDTLLAKGGDDVLVGGSGNDLLDGGDGSDSYLFTTGSGSDQIVESSDDVISVDRVVFGSGTNPIDLYFSRSGEDLLVEQLNSDDQITIIGWYGSSGASIEQFSAADGSLIAGSEIDQLIESMASFTAESGYSWADAVSHAPDQISTVLAHHWDTQGVSG